MRLVNSMSRGPLTRFVFCGVSSLIRSSAVWDTVRVIKALHKSTGGSFGRSTARGEGSSISRMSGCFGGN